MAENRNADKVAYGGRAPIGLTADTGHDAPSPVSAAAIPCTETDSPAGGKTVAIAGVQHMAIDKAAYGTTALVDSTPGTVDAAHPARGCTARDAGGNPIAGTPGPQADSNDAKATRPKPVSGTRPAKPIARDADGDGSNSPSMPNIMPAALDSR